MISCDDASQSAPITATQYKDWQVRLRVLRDEMSALDLEKAISALQKIKKEVDLSNDSEELKSYIGLLSKCLGQYWRETNTPDFPQEDTDDTWRSYRSYLNTTIETLYVRIHLAEKAGL